MRFDILTLFPEFFDSPLKTSLIGKALEKQTFEVNVVNLRDFSDLPHNQVDDTPYGGGAGMVMKADVLAKAVQNLKTSESVVILTEAAGQAYSQARAEELSTKQHIIIICGRYEGVDQRFIDKYVDLELSIGDYVLNGGETASLVLLESVSRLLPGVIGAEASLEEESFSKQIVDGVEKRILEYPHYTRPEEFEGEKVPPVLLSGDHQKIKQWREEKAVEKTKQVRPDLLK